MPTAQITLAWLESLLLTVCDDLRECGADAAELSLNGQEKMGTTWPIYKMNKLLHGISHADLMFVQHTLAVLKSDGRMPMPNKLSIKPGDLLRQHTVEGGIEYKAGWNPDVIVRTQCAFALGFETLEESA